MNIEIIREYCLSKPLATEDTAFGPDTILFRVYDKIFACIDLERPDLVVVKCDAEYALSLREQYSGIRPAWHWNKRYWNELCFDCDVDDALIFRLIDLSLVELLKKLLKKTRQAYAALR